MCDKCFEQNPILAWDLHYCQCSTHCIQPEIICKEYFIYFAISITWGWQIFNIADISWNSFWKRNDLSLNGEHSWRGHETLGSESGESRDKGGYQKFIKQRRFCFVHQLNMSSLLKIVSSPLAGRLKNHCYRRTVNGWCIFTARLLTLWHAPSRNASVMM